HQGAVHAGDNVPGHHAFRCAVVDECARAVRLEAQYDFFARIDVGQRGTAQGARGAVEVDVVRHVVGGGVDQRQFDIVVLADHHGGAGHAAVEGLGPDG